MQFHFAGLDDDGTVQSPGLSIEAAAQATERASWCWPPIEGERGSEPLPIAADILADCLSDGHEVLLCSKDGQQFVRLVPTDAAGR